MQEEIITQESDSNPDDLTSHEIKNDTNKKSPENKVEVNKDVVEPMSEELDPDIELRDVRGLIEVLDVAPTHAPKDLMFDQIKIVGTKLYIYNYVTKTWLEK